ncbi:hypothetical protein ACQPX6_03055 [Actinomycetospora sp. CA-101289]|uniref:hypothetical protein n=1 Tax=Actinomycetospora sp. CA-101289 TaxID=3239893 RepID=UPI003D967D33
MVEHIFVSGPLRPPDSDPVHLVVEGLDQAGPSFEVRVFVDNPEADEHTTATADDGYAGSIHVYGGGGGVDPAAGRLPMSRAVDVTGVVRGHRARSEVTVTLVAVPYSDVVTPEQAGLALAISRAYLANDPPS